MKIFAVYFKVALTKKPDWFDEFRNKYQGKVGSVLHITLIQPRWISEANVATVKTKIAEVLKRHEFSDEDKKALFDHLVSGPEDNGDYVYMLLARKNNRLIAFQKNLRDSLSDYEQYYDQITKSYEVDFCPHLTVGNGISPSEKQKADAYFASDYACEGNITELVLPVVKDMSVAEADNPKNLTVFEI